MHIFFTSEKKNVHLLLCFSKKWTYSLKEKWHHSMWCRSKTDVGTLTVWQVFSSSFPGLVSSTGRKEKMKMEWCQSNTFILTVLKSDWQMQLTTLYKPSLLSTALLEWSVRGQWIIHRLATSSLIYIQFPWHIFEYSIKKRTFVEELHHQWHT